MKTLFGSAVCLALILSDTAGAQSTSLTRSEVTAIRAKLVAVQQAMGADPAGYLKETEDFNLPTDFNPAQGGKFWPITSSIRLRYTDKASTEGRANAEKAVQDFQTKYAAAAASGNVEALTKMTEELQKLQAAAMTPPAKQHPMDVNVQLNMNPTVGIDPAAVVLERAGVIALRDKNVSSDTGSVTVYVDPVALKNSSDLAKIELKTADGGVGNKIGVYHVVIQLNGAVADLESWVKSFDFGAMLGAIDAQ
ncbi:MAG TPA: hypothetical protein VGL98_11640 [Gammaproteobacteria bacterium]